MLESVVKGHFLKNFYSTYVKILTEITARKRRKDRGADMQVIDLKSLIRECDKLKEMDLFIQKKTEKFLTYETYYLVFKSSLHF